jgi:hypothetical protein
VFDNTNILVAIGRGTNLGAPVIKRQTSDLIGLSDCGNYLKNDYAQRENAANMDNVSEISNNLVYFN